MEKKKVSKKKKKNTDVIAVFAILAFIILLGVVLSCINSYKNSEKLHKDQASVSKEELTQEKTLFITLGAISVVTIGIYTTVKIRSSIKKKRILEEKRRRQMEIEAAKKRISESKYDDILKAGNNILSERKKTEQILAKQNRNIRHKYDLNSFKDLDDDEFEESIRKNNGYSYNKRNYDDYDEKEKKSIIFVYAIKENKSLILGIIGIIIVLVIIGIIILI